MNKEGTITQLIGAVVDVKFKEELTRNLHSIRSK